MCPADYSLWSALRSGINAGLIVEVRVADEEDEAAVEASLDELLAKKEEEKEEEEESILDLERGEERAETLVVKVLPVQQNEFTCRSCFLVKHRSQLADAKKMICKDCA